MLCVRMPHVVPGYEHGEAKRQMTQVKKHERMKQSGVSRTRYFKNAMCRDRAAPHGPGNSHKMAVGRHDAQMCS